LINVHPLKYIPGSNYKFILDVVTKRQILSSGRIELEFEKNEFKFSGECLSVEKLANPIVPAIDPLLYKCVLNNKKNKLTVAINKTIEVNSQIR
jgi:hypothetical protein